MSVNLTKGARVDLSKPDGTALENISFRLGWDVVGRKKGNPSTPRKGLGRLFGAVEEMVNDVTSQIESPDIDMDSSVILLDGNGHRVGTVFFGNKFDSVNGIRLDRDDLTGNSTKGGDDETITINLSQIKSNVEKLELWINIYRGVERNQHLGMIENAFARVVDERTKVEMFRFNLSENYSNQLSCHVATIYRRNGVWKINALGEGANDTGIREIESRYI